MVKRILLSIVMLVLIAYLAVAITAFNRKPADQTCRDMELVIKDTAYAGFITKEELKGILQHKGIYPIVDALQHGLPFAMRCVQIGIVDDEGIGAVGLKGDDKFLRAHRQGGT